MCDGKEPVEVQGGGYGDVTIMEIGTMEGCEVEFLIGVAVVEVKRIIGGDEGAG